MLYYVVCIVMLSYVLLYYVMLCCVVLYCVMLCYVMLLCDVVFNMALLGAAIMCLQGCRMKPRLQKQGDIELAVASSCCPTCQ